MADIAMAKRLQIVLQESEYRELQRVAHARRMSVGEWVREALKLACRHEADYGAEKKLAAVRSAVRHSGPAVDVEQMLKEIESGYLGRPSS